MRLRSRSPARDTKRRASDNSYPIVTRAEVATHAYKDNLWVIVGEYVYDLTRFLNVHPGGMAPLRYGGRDATDIFHKIHRPNTLAAHAPLIVGVLPDKERREVRPPEVQSTTSQATVEEDADGYDKRRPGDGGREFGDHMANEGETSHIPTVILAMYTTLALWSVLVSRTTGCSVWTMPLFYACGMVAFYTWHYLAHSESYHLTCKRIGLGYCSEMHEIHMEHHLEKFPPSDFYGSAANFRNMYPDGKPTIWTLMDLTRTTNIARGTAVSRELDAKAKTPHSPLAHEWLLLAMLAAIAAAGPVFFGVSGATTACAVAMFFVVATVGNALHMSFHVRNFHLEKYAWYRELRTLHYVHHLGDMKSNLAMLNLGLDGMMHSLSVLDPEPPRSVPLSSSSLGFYSTLVAEKSDGDFPDGISAAAVGRSVGHAGASALLLGFDLPVDVQDSMRMRARMEYHGYPTVLLRLVLTVMAVVMWHATESTLGLEGYNDTEWVAVGGSGGVTADPGHLVMDPLRTWMLAGDGHRAQMACKASAIVSDGIVVIAIIVSLVGPSFRPMLAVVFTLVSRRLLVLAGAALAVRPAPSSHWPLPPSWPTLFVVHGPSSHQFFSARVALACVAAMELLGHTVYRLNVWRHTRKASRAGRGGAALVAVMILAFTIGLSLALRVSWTVDVCVAVVFARISTIYAARLAPWVDAYMPS